MAFGATKTELDDLRKGGGDLKDSAGSKITWKPVLPESTEDVAQVPELVISGICSKFPLVREPPKTRGEELRNMSKNKKKSRPSGANETPPVMLRFLDVAANFRIFISKPPTRKQGRA